MMRAFKVSAGRKATVQDGDGKTILWGVLPTNMFSAQRLIRAQFDKNNSKALGVAVEKMWGRYFVVFFRGEWGAANTLHLSVPVSLSRTRLLFE